MRKTLREKKYSGGKVLEGGRDYFFEKPEFGVRSEKEATSIWNDRFNPASLPAGRRSRPRAGQAGAICNPDLLEVGGFYNFDFELFGLTA